MTFKSADAVLKEDWIHIVKKHLSKLNNLIILYYFFIEYKNTWHVTLIAPDFLLYKSKWSPVSVENIWDILARCTRHILVKIHIYMCVQAHTLTSSQIASITICQGSHLAWRTPSDKDSQIDRANPWNTIDPNNIWARWRLLPSHAKLVLADNL